MNDQAAKDGPAGVSSSSGLGSIEDQLTAEEAGLELELEGEGEGGAGIRETGPGGDEAALGVFNGCGSSGGSIETGRGGLEVALVPDNIEVVPEVVEDEVAGVEAVEAGVDQDLNGLEVGGGGGVTVLGGDRVGGPDGSGAGAWSLFLFLAGTL